MNVEVTIIFLIIFSSNILKSNGSAIDAAIAAMFCNGIVNMHSMGLGGGFLMTIYTKSTRQAITLNAREVAPLAATHDMYKNDKKAAREGKRICIIN